MPTPRRSCSCVALGSRLPAPCNPEYIPDSRATVALPAPTLQTLDPGLLCAPMLQTPALRMLHTWPHLKNHSQHHCRLVSLLDPNATVALCVSVLQTFIFVATLHILAFPTSLPLQARQSTRLQSCCYSASTSTSLWLHDCSKGTHTDISATSIDVGAYKLEPIPRGIPSTVTSFIREKEMRWPQHLSLLLQTTAALAIEDPCNFTNTNSSWHGCNEDCTAGPSSELETSFQPSQCPCTTH